MGKKLWYVVTEEGIEGQGDKTALEALVSYLELNFPVTEDRINEVVSGKSEINYVEAFSKKELDAMPEV